MKKVKSIQNTYFSLEKTRYNNKTKRAILLSDGSVTRSQKKILQEQYKYYKKLNTSNPSAKFTYINEDQCKISDEENLC